MCATSDSYVWHDSYTCKIWCPPMKSRRWVSHVTHDHSEWVMSHIFRAYVWHDSLKVTHDSFIRVTWLSHSGLTRSCHTYLERVSDATSRHTRFCLVHTCDMTHSLRTHSLLSHIPGACDMTHSHGTYSHGTHSLMSYIPGASESCHVMSHHVTLAPVSCIRVTSSVLRRPHMCDKTHSYVWNEMTHSYVWHDSFICLTRLVHTCDVTHSLRSYVWHDLQSSSYVWYDPLTWDSLAPFTHSWSEWVVSRHVTLAAVLCIRATWLTHSGLIGLSHMSVESESCHTRLVHTCDMTHSHGTHSLMSHIHT